MRGARATTTSDSQTPATGGGVRTLDAVPGALTYTGNASWGSGAVTYLDTKYTDYKDGRGFDVATGLAFGEGSLTRLPARDFTGNEIVLVAPKDSTVETKIERGFDLAKLIGDGKLAMGDFKAVPAGRYGKAALESLGVWSSVEGKVAQAENVRAALKLVSTGEAALGLVYATDAHAEKGVKVVGTFPVTM